MAFVRTTPLKHSTIGENFKFTGRGAKRFLVMICHDPLMTEVENFALALLFYGLVGIPLGIASLAQENQKKEKSKRFDVIYLFAYFSSIVYGFLGFKFIDGRYLIWVLGLVFIVGGYHFGKIVGSSREDHSMKTIGLAAIASVPLPYHHVLS